MEQYFVKFPIISYSNTVCRDISRRVVLSEDSRNNPINFYPWEIKREERSDWLAYHYYEDSDLDWLIYLTNGVIDPYYGWHLGIEEFNDFLKDKYGSVEESIRVIKFYRNNWSEDQFEVSTERYNSLPYELRKYYTPHFGYGTKILSYRRKQEDWITNTNKLLRFVIDLSGNVAFVEGERVVLSQGANAVGNATIVTANSSTLVVQHISGNTSANNIATGAVSGAAANVTDTDLLIENISDLENVYWTPVTAFDWENEQNESRKHVNLLDANRALDVAEDLRQKLKQD